MTTGNSSWALAETVQLTPATERLGTGELGVIAVRPHPTGWFISARYSPDLAEDDVEDFAAFVAVRSYLLLELGLQDDLWEPGGDGSWRAVCTASRLDLPQEIDAVR